MPPQRLASRVTLGKLQGFVGIHKRARSTVPLGKGGSLAARFFVGVGVGIAGGSREKSSGDPEEAAAPKGQAHQRLPTGGPIPPPAPGA